MWLSRILGTQHPEKTVPCLTGRCTFARREGAETAPSICPSLSLSMTRFGASACEVLSLSDYILADSGSWASRASVVFTASSSSSHPTNLRLSLLHDNLTILMDISSEATAGYRNIGHLMGILGQFKKVCCYFHDETFWRFHNRIRHSPSSNHPFVSSSALLFFRFCSSSARLRC